MLAAQSSGLSLSGEALTATPADPWMSGRSHGVLCSQGASAAAPCCSTWLHICVHAGGAAGTGRKVM